MITVNQDEYIRMLDMLKYQAVIILKNTNVDKLNEELNDVLDYMDMCNDLQITFDQYIAAKDKYNLDATYLEELNKTKKQLDEYVNSRWNVQELVDGRKRRNSHFC